MQGDIFQSIWQSIGGEAKQLLANLWQSDFTTLIGTISETHRSFNWFHVLSAPISPMLIARYDQNQSFFG